MTQVRQETVSFKGFVLQQDILEGQQLCKTCGGVGLVIREYPFYVGGERLKDMIELHRRWVGPCPDCYAGVQHVCKHCGKGYRQELQHNCDGARAERDAEHDRKIREKAEKATKFTVEEAIAAGVPFLFSEGLDRYLSWDELGDLEPEEQCQLGIVWACEQTQIGLNAHDILETACDDLHEDAVEYIPDAAKKELQDFLSAWVDKYGRHTITYYPDYTRVVVIDPPGDSAPAVGPESEEADQ